MFKSILATAFALTALSAHVSYAAIKNYQVTGAVIESTATSLIVQKGKERFEIERDPSTKVQADLKAGDKVTVYYKMTATEVESKGAAAQPAAKKEAKEKKAGK